MNRYRFEIFARNFKLVAHTSTYEGSGLEWCRRYMTKFQKEVANVPMKVIISKREKQKNNWEYHGKPYLYNKTLLRKPLVKRIETPPDESAAEADET